MTVCRTVALVALLAAAPIHQAGAQFGGMMPGGPGMGGPAGPGMGGFGAPTQPPPGCQQLLTMRDETQKAGQAIQQANERKANVQIACRLFRTFLATEAKFMRAMEEHSQQCGVPPQALKQVKDGHIKASEIGKQVCEAAAQGPRPAGPSLSDALGANFTVPDTKDKRGGTFDTLTGNALAR